MADKNVGKCSPKWPKDARANKEARGSLIAAATPTAARVARISIRNKILRGSLTRSNILLAPRIEYSQPVNGWPSIRRSPDDDQSHVKSLPIGRERDNYFMRDNNVLENPARSLTIHV